MRKSLIKVRGNVDGETFLISPQLVDDLSGRFTLLWETHLRDQLSKSWITTQGIEQKVGLQAQQT